MDTIAIIASDRIERMSMRNADTAFLLIEEGRKTEALEVSTHSGGGGVNAAVALARLGFSVDALVKLGCDERAKLILDRLGQEGVSVRWSLRDERAPTGASVMISSHERNAAIFTFRGANTLLTERELPEDAFAVDLVCVAGLSNESAECFPAVVAMAKAKGAMVAANPGIRQLSARRRAFLECLALLDVLTINRLEAGALVPALVARFGEAGSPLKFALEDPMPELVLRGVEGGGFELPLTAFFGALLALGVKHVVVTDGANGAFVASAGQILFCPAPKCEVKGTAGAGDALSSTFAGFLALGHPPEVALRAATINAASVIGQVDTQSGLLRMGEIMSRLEDAAAGVETRRWVSESI